MIERNDTMKRKRKSIDELIEAFDGKIEKAQARLKELKAQRQALVEKKENVAFAELSAIIQEKGLTATQAVEILRNASAE